MSKKSYSINNHNAKLYSSDGKLIIEGSRTYIHNNYKFDIKKQTLKQTVEANSLILEDLDDQNSSVNIDRLEKDKPVENNSTIEEKNYQDSTLMLLEKKKQVIFYGPPGTGKTYRTKSFSKEFVAENSENDDKHIEFITFHPSYSYEEFIEGITVETEGEGVASENPKYMLRPGIFKNICKRALGAAINKDKKVDDSSWADIYNDYLKQDDVGFEEADKHVLIIDEINRGDIAKIFGELITLLEADKRLGEQNELTVKLPASRDEFGVPPNLYIIGTMNTADRSIALLDVALRRRFGFIEMNPDFNVLEENIKNDNLKELLKPSAKAIKKINEVICKDKTIGRDKQIGHSFLFKVDSQDDLVLVWRYEILPLLEEYCYSDYTKINQILFGKDSSDYISQSEGIKNVNSNDLNKFLGGITGENNKE